MEKILVTGAAGFIGSHLCDVLLARGNEVVGYDNLCAGKMENLKSALKSRHFRFVRADILDEAKIAAACEGISTIYHLAADPLVKESAENPGNSFKQNIVGTFRMLEAARKTGVKHVVLTSTSTVYGDAKEIPTPESALLEPISNYGASKLAGENYCAAYAHTYGLRATVFRYANIFGERSGHGVMCDFYAKLRANPRELKILGDGKQDKSYLHVDDCVEASLLAVEKQQAVFDAYNIGSRKKYTVTELAQIICKIMNVKPKFSYTGGKRGWVGDVPLMLLSTKKIEKLGWHEKIGFEDGVRRYLKWLAAEGQ